MRFQHLLKDEKIIAIIGLAKNTGKTVTMRALLNEFNAAGRRTGITSSGRDGEAFDALDAAIEKPRLELLPGNLAATTAELFEHGTARVKYLKETGYRTPLGTVVIAEVQQAGLIEIAGPSTTRGLKAVCQEMLALGAERVLLDGAINRMAAASPQVCDGVILATGAVLSNRLEVVVAETRRRVDLLRLPEIADPQIKELALSARRLAAIDRDGRLRPLSEGDGVENRPGWLARQLSEQDEYLVCKAACTESLLDEVVMARRGRPMTMLAADSTRLFISPHGWNYYIRSGITFQVLHALRLICVTANPVAPHAHAFETGEMIPALREALPGVTVLNALDKEND